MEKNDIDNFFELLKSIESDEFMGMVEKCLSDDEIESMGNYLQDFYGLEDDEEVGHITQIMVMGYLFKTYRDDPASLK